MEITWLDRSAYPFEGHTLDVDGGLMHYVGEGSAAQAARQGSIGQVQYRR